MDLLSALILGIVQGATEFLPVSSSAHLCLLHTLFGLSSPDKYPALDVMLHAGTLAAVIMAYRHEAGGLFTALFTAPVKLIRRRGDLSALNTYERTVCFAVTATVPIIAFTLAGADKAADTVSRSPAAMGALLIINGFMLMTAEKVRAAELRTENIRMRHALFAGMFEAAAVFPGISRSGSMITGGMICGIERKEAVRLSFICSIPAVLGACVLKLPAAASSAFAPELFPVYAAGAVTAAISGMFAIKLIKTVTERFGNCWFSIYCFTVGSAAVIAGAGGI